MDLKRFFRHVSMSELKARKCFPQKTLDTIETAVREGERTHRGEIRVVIEQEYTTWQLWSDLKPRDRAIELFSLLRVWDTEDNTGVLIYILLADRHVEIVADRGIAKRVAQAEWDAMCRIMQEDFRKGDYAHGTVEAVRAASKLLATHFPGGERNPNEIPDRPLMM